jgi:S-formylglutathione hydrolase FrmB
MNRQIPIPDLFRVPFPSPCVTNKRMNVADSVITRRHLVPLVGFYSRTVSKGELIIRLCGFLAAILLGVTSLRSATVTTIAVTSEGMKKDVPVTVILPDSVRKEGTRFPVLYLLHGYSNNNGSWAERTSIRDLAEQYGVIVVCPDGGFSSWYFDSPEDPSYRYETFVSKELVTEVDKRFPTLPNRASRAIAGLSMGGHGAMFLAFRHPDIYGTAVSFSGGVDLRPFPDNWDIAKRLGSLQDYPDRWKECSVITLAEKISPGQQALSIDCGVDDFFIPVNRNLHSLLLERHVPHDYSERPGGHDWHYWANAIKYQMLFISDHLAH